MTRTRPSTIIGLVLAGGIVAFLLQLGLAAASQPKFRPEYSIAVTLIAIAIVVIALSVPVRQATRAQATRGRVRARIDPFHATRVVLITKASSIVGALFSGLAVGLLLELLTRSGGVNGDNLLRALAVVGASIVLLIAGLLGEFFCTVPPSDDDDRNGDPLPGSLDR
ncbi:MAG: DUF3180 domain-containing protein [Pseudolysinimonas sp.]|uniref:DUF3180 domain-containing protein n=1 Tax=Pseudolysinimonas sp. TaxID=2680009 RepID=UPI003262DAF8